MNTPLVLCILDGWGERAEAQDNAIRLAHTPCFESLRTTWPSTVLAPSGLDVGLPEGQIGNSEVGHMNIGAGRIVPQDLVRINAAVENDSLKDNPVLQTMLHKVKTLHLLGLCSHGGVHALHRHMEAVATIAKERKVNIQAHLWTDGRDVLPGEAMTCVRAFEALHGNIASVCGRYFAMDRNNNLQRTARATRLLLHGDAEHRTCSAEEALRWAYEHNISDEFIPPIAVGDYQGMQDGDGVLCCNFRPDRVRQILTSLLENGPRFAACAGMTDYGEALRQHYPPCFPPLTLEDGLGAVVAAAGLKQLRLAETEKYPHVTYFFNGGREEPYPGEERILVPSPVCDTYDQKPAMSAQAITEHVIEALHRKQHTLIVVNFANPDMVGHTGVSAAVIEAVEHVDRCLQQITKTLAAVSGLMLLTADHGNAEILVDAASGTPHTAHTTNPVPLILVGAHHQLHTGGRLADLAPTALELLGLPQPAAMTGHSLISSGHQ